MAIKIKKVFMHFLTIVWKHPKYTSKNFTEEIFLIHPNPGRIAMNDPESASKELWLSSNPTPTPDSLPWLREIPTPIPTPHPCFFTNVKESWIWYKSESTEIAIQTAACSRQYTLGGAIAPPSLPGKGGDFSEFWGWGMESEWYWLSRPGFNQGITFPTP